MSKPPDNTGSKQARTQFKKGQSGNPAGRPKGTRNKLSKDFIEALFDDFTVHGPAAIVALREEKPNEYVKVISGLVPTQFQQVDDEGKVQKLGMIALPVKGSK